MSAGLDTDPDSDSHEMPDSFFVQPLVSGVSPLQLINVIGYFVFLIVSSIGGAGGLGASIGSVSAAYPTMITPAGWAFSIWSAVFSLTGCLTLFQAFPSRRLWSYEKLGWWWALNTVIGEGLWTVAWVKGWGSQWVAACTLAFIVATGACIYIRIDAGVAPLTGSGPPNALCRTLTHPFCCKSTLSKARPAKSLVDFVFLEGGIGLYLGWTTAACIVNFSIALVASGFQNDGKAAPFFASLLLIASTSLAFLAALFRLDFWYAGAIAWALTGIWRNQQSDSTTIVHNDSVSQVALFSCTVSWAATLAAIVGRIMLFREGKLPVARDSDSPALLFSPLTDSDSVQ